jgi:chromosome segregation ATPase
MNKLRSLVTVATVVALGWTVSHVAAEPGGGTVKDTVKLLKDRDAKIRARAAEELGELGAAAREALPALVDALDDESPAVRQAAKQALARVVKDSAGPTKAELELAVRTAEVKRLTKEIGMLEKVVKERDKQVLSVLDELAEAKAKLKTAEVDAQLFQKRAAELQDQLRESQAALAKALQDGGKAKQPLRNPPPNKVEGVIDEVDAKDPTLVKINVGADQGLKKDHTLEVYRTEPMAEYLGRIQIIDADNRMAVARWIGDKAKAPKLKKGDKVVDKLN